MKSSHICETVSTENKANFSDSCIWFVAMMVEKRKMHWLTDDTSASMAVDRIRRRSGGRSVARRPSGHVSGLFRGLDLEITTRERKDV